jgi:hypothetical protein
VSGAHVARGGHALARAHGRGARNAATTGMGTRGRAHAAGGERVARDGLGPEVGSLGWTTERKAPEAPSPPM